MTKKRLEVKFEIEENRLTLANFDIIYSDVQFLAQKKIKYPNTEREPIIRYIHVGTNPKRYGFRPHSLEYSVVDFFTETPEFPGDGAETKYTHAQVREMKGAAKRKQRKAEQ